MHKQTPRTGFIVDDANLPARILFSATIEVV